MRKKLKFLSLGCIIILILAMSLVVQNSAKAGISIVSVTIKDGSGNNISAPSTVVPATQIIFDPDGNVNTDYGIGISFESTFDVSLVEDGDVAITQENLGDDIVKDVADVAGQIVRIDILTESDSPSDLITIDISGSHITTPNAGGTYTISILIADLGADGDWGGGDDVLLDGGFAAIVIAPTSGAGTNLVQINGTVDPTLTLDLSDTSCSLGTLVSTSVNTCQYDTTVSTNASSGYTAYIRDDGNLRNATNDINDVAGGTTVAGSEEYGVATSDADPVDITAQETSGNCTTLNGGSDPANALALTTSDQSYAAEDAAVDSDVVTLCHSASITGTTPAGAYLSVVTITVVGNF
jgi:hypothetical protein